jgi:hypothetical protein
VDQAAFLEIQRRMAEEEARRGTHPSPQAPVPTGMERVAGAINNAIESPRGQAFLNHPATRSTLNALDYMEQVNMRPLVALLARMRGDDAARDAIMGGGAYEPGMLTGNELVDMGIGSLLSADNLIPGLGLVPSPGQLGIAGRVAGTLRKADLTAPAWARAMNIGSAWDAAQVASRAAADLGERMSNRFRGLGDVLARTLDATLEPADRMLPARRVASGTKQVTYRGRQVPLRTLRSRWVNQSVDNLTDAQLDEWATRIRQGMDIEDTRRVLDVPGEAPVELRHWYDTSPVAARVKQALGDEDGELFFNMLVPLFAVTSPRTNVRDNATIAVGLLHHLANGRTIEDIARMSFSEFGNIAPGKALFMGGHRAINADNMNDIRRYIEAVDAGRAPSASNADAVRRAMGNREFTIDELRDVAEGDVLQLFTSSGNQNLGSIGNLLYNGTIDGQKISSFFRNLMGDFTPITIDAHNIRQTLALSGVDLSNPNARRDLMRRLGITDTNAMKPYLQNEVVLPGRWVENEAGERVREAARVLSPEEVSNQFANDLYAAAVSNSSLYGDIENFQKGVLERLIETGKVPPMTPAEFQARLWVGGGDISQVADSVPAAQAFMDAIMELGKTRGWGDDVDTVIQNIWRDPAATEEVMLRTVYESTGLRNAGLESWQDLREFLQRRAVSMSGDVARDEVAPAQSDSFDREQWTPPTGMDDERLGEIARQLNQP